MIICSTSPPFIVPILRFRFTRLFIVTFGIVIVIFFILGLLRKLVEPTTVRETV